MSGAFVDLANARKGIYKKVISRILSTGKCPFCPEYFKYHKKPIFKESGDWFLTENSWPYKNAKTHLIIIGKKHREEFSDLTKKDLEAIAYLTRWAIKKYRIKGGGFVMRFGDTRFTGASVSHMHCHIISPKINKKTGRARTVSFPIG
ncbi:MAG: HIT domain-containing protein [Candidatus Wildermuthbacteria bacterium]|nr:HIT domain-containing protein [Candidatus Wildermuthbacteria bacterium]